VENVLQELPEKDRELLRMFFLEERDKAEICKRFQVSEDYLRVLLYRAKSRFRTTYFKSVGATH
jgi:DNA-directed RNA polymerase specialized sigma24 family protein